MTEPVISVVMSVYNGEQFLSEAVNSILEQSETRFEFLIVDDGSSDNSNRILEEFAANDHRVKVFRQENKGLIASLNRLLEMVSTPYIARMDSDDVAHPERFAKQYAWMQQHPDIATLGTQTRNIDVHGNRLPDSKTLPMDSQDIKKALDSGSNPICHPSTMIRADAIRQIGGYRSAYHYCEDYDFWLRLSEHYQIANLPDHLLYYRYSEGQVTNRHIVEMIRGSSYALYAHRQRLAGKPDPFAHLDSLPTLEQLESENASPRMIGELREHIIRLLRYSPQHLEKEVLPLIDKQLHDGWPGANYLGVVKTLIASGQFSRALGLVTSLLRARLRR